MRTDWEELDSRYIWHPYTQMRLLPDAVGVVRASGSFLELADGRRIFDAVSSWWVTLHGHAHPKIANAIAEQAATLEQVIFAGFTHEPASRLAERLIARAPQGLEKIFYSDNGSTAVEVALKMCIQYWQLRGERRMTFLALEDSYHGDTFGAMSASSRGSFTAPFDPLLFDVIRLPFPKASEDESLSAEEKKFLFALEQQCQANKNIAGFIYEPLLLGAGGMRTWRASVLSAAIKIAREHNIICIADEVLTGFGRTGTFFASDQADLSPDIMTLSKGITGGFMAFGATLCTNEIFDTFLSNDRAKTFFHGHSYTGSPLSCAAANASLDIFESEPVFERINTIEHVHRKCMPLLASRVGYTYRILGTMAAMEPLESEGYLSERSLEIHRASLANGILIRPLGDTIYFLPPYSTTAEDLEHAYDVLGKILTP